MAHSDLHHRPPEGQKRFCPIDFACPRIPLLVTKKRAAVYSLTAHILALKVTLYMAPNNKLLLTKL